MSALNLLEAVLPWISCSESSRRDLASVRVKVEAMEKLLRELAGLRDGLDNSSSSAEEYAARLAAQAQVLVGGAA